MRLLKGDNGWWELEVRPTRPGDDGIRGGSVWLHKDEIKWLISEWAKLK